MQHTPAARALLLIESKNRADKAQRQVDFRKSLRNFGLAVLWIALTVAVATFLAGLRTGAVRF